ncbi:MAG TPA: MBL fold metallo-hydrolase [Acetobacteraceae bacterium]|nr:MBL fold metallo-hydrolase [Acetobacteraceae bacterium]
MEKLRPAERLEILVLVDNVTDTLSGVPAFVARESANLRRAGMIRMSGAGMCCAIHGLSLVVTAHFAGAPSRTVLFDAGPWGGAVDHNGSRLGVPYASIEAVVLSHGHWDHAGGLERAAALIHAARGEQVPCYLHPGMFQERGQRQPDGGVFPMDFVPEPARLAEAGFAPIVTDKPQHLADGAFWVSGEIPRVSGYERGIPSQVTRAGPDAPWTPDPLVTDERFLAANVAGKGLVVFSACSHAGIVNVLHHARQSFPVERLHAVMGGFHLSGENEVIIPETVRDLGTFGLSLIIPAHCTGWRAVNALERAYGEAVVLPSAVGRTFTL